MAFVIIIRPRLFLFVILLIIQANDRAIADDQYMVQCLYEWSKEGLLTSDDKYYGQRNEESIDNEEAGELEPPVTEQPNASAAPEKKPTEVGNADQKLKEIRKMCLQEMAKYSEDEDGDIYKLLHNIFQLTHKD